MEPHFDHGTSEDKQIEISIHGLTATQAAIHMEALNVLAEKYNSELLGLKEQAKGNFNPDKRTKLEQHIQKYNKLQDHIIALDRTYGKIKALQQQTESTTSNEQQEQKLIVPAT